MLHEFGIQLQSREQDVTLDLQVIYTEARTTKCVISLNRLAAAITHHCIQTLKYIIVADSLRLRQQESIQAVITLR